MRNFAVGGSLADFYFAYDLQADDFYPPNSGCEPGINNWLVDYSQKHW